MTAESWYRQSFADDYLRIYRHRDEADARRAVDHLLDRARLPSASRCLDLGCGPGRHLVLLLDRGLDAIGLDLSARLLREARRLPGLQPRLVRGDMRYLPFRPSFDAVFSFFTSFGYFLEDAENLRVLEEIHRVLKPGGCLILDYLNPKHVVDNLVARDEQTLPGFQLTQQRWIDSQARTVNKRLTVADDDGTRQYDERVKLYAPDDFQRFCATAGLQIKEILGDVEGGTYSRQSPRQIVFARRPTC